MLKEADIDRYSRWSDVKRKVDGDPRYKLVESGVQREDWFRDYMIKVGSHLKMLYRERQHIKPSRDLHKPTFWGLSFSHTLYLFNHSTIYSHTHSHCSFHLILTDHMLLLCNSSPLHLFSTTVAFLIHV